MKLNMSKYGVFWNDYNIDEDSYIKHIQDVCEKYLQLEASETETRELISFFGRSYSNICWQDTVRIFSGSVIRKLMETNGSEMRLAVIPALRTDFDRTRTIILFGSAALPKDNTAPEGWVNMSKPISVWDRNGDYAPDFVKHYNFDMDAYIADFRKQDKQKACSLELRLANSIATLMWRTEVADVLELWAIAKDYNGSFNDILEQAEQIEPSTEVRYLVNKILSMPKALFDYTLCENKPNYNIFFGDMKNIGDKLFML